MLINWKSCLMMALSATFGAAFAWAYEGTGADYGSYYVADEPAAAAPATPAPGPSCEGIGPTCEGTAPACGMDGACDGSCGDGCGCGGGCGGWGGWNCCPLEDLGEAHRLFDGCWAECRGINAGGYVAQSYVWNPYQPADRWNGPMTWLDRANDYQMNEVFMYFGRAADNGGCGFDWGYNINALYGTNYRWDTSAGFESNFGNGTFYGLAVPQLYVDFAINDWNVKVGRWNSPVGYYVIGQGNNFFAVLPYTFQYGEPFTHTGVYASKKASDTLSYGLGLTHGWDSSDNTGNPHAGGVATVTYTPDEDRAFYYVGVFGPEANFSGVNGGFTSRYLQTLVYTHKFSDDVTGVLQSDFGYQNDATAAGDDAKWYGINTYLYWNQTCRTQWGLNAEWFRDQGGFRVGQVLPSIGSPNASGFTQTGAPAGFNGSFYRIMFGPKYYFTPNLYGRVAAAFDWYSGTTDAAGELPFDDGTKRHQEVLAFDLIWTF